MEAVEGDELHRNGGSKKEVTLYFLTAQTFLEVKEGEPFSFGICNEFAIENAGWKSAGSFENFREFLIERTEIA